MRDYVGEHFAKHPLDIHIRPRPVIVCKDGVRYSVQASRFHYCTPKADEGPWSSLEVFGPFTNDPEGWVPVGDINRRIHRHGGTV